MCNEQCTLMAEVQPTANTIDTYNLEAPLVTKRKELPVCDFNSLVSS